MIIKAPSLETARTCCNADAYAPLTALRKSAGQFRTAFIEGDAKCANKTSSASVSRPASQTR
ncbi:DUF1330 domain-containing protein [Aliiroseovarius sp. Z3]|nr:DUF1330 domain-containing protein [Aliiroseovarius sp. Z3]